MCKISLFTYNIIKDTRMQEFFSGMESMEQFYWYVAIGASIVFIIQTILTFIGAEMHLDTSMHGDLSGHDMPTVSALHLLTLRNLISFILGFGWTGATFYKTIDNKLLLTGLAVIVGLIFVTLCFLVMHVLIKLSENNTFKIEDAIGKTGEVYLTIPPSKQGKGKILISIKGSTHELAAITSDRSALKYGSIVEVTGIEGETLIVALPKQETNEEENSNI